MVEQGDAILGDPQRLKAMLRDLAKDEPPALRRAFGCCIETGAYAVLKNARDAAVRASRKETIAQRLHDDQGLDIPVCAEALNILEAALYGAANPPLQPPALPNTKRDGPALGGSSAPSSTASRGGASISGAFNAVLKGKISRKTLIFGAVAGIGALIGELISEVFRLNAGTPASSFQLVLNVGIWAAFIGLGITVALNIAQGMQLKRIPPGGVLIKTALIGIAIGIAGGAAAQLIFGATADISTIVEIISRIICWGILGWGLGFGASFYVPNYPVKRAMLAGLAGGVVGGSFFRATFFIPEPFGRVIGITILGCFIGLFISFIEEALREAWLTVIWGPKESATITLGAKPVVFGSSREASVFLPSRPGSAPVPPVRAIVAIENGQVIFDDKQTGRRSVLQNGGEFALDRLRVVVHTKS